eukprot:GHVQ01024834.1.p2 GENE.GHVQ01024834.1~~GHVQ01024834.1.p2  ORF type:complete len:186 (-),score=28.41 GHVQ01024834.1:894-1451(-)
MQMEYDTEENFGKVNFAAQRKLLGGRRFLLNPSHDFRTGESVLQLEADVTKPVAELNENGDKLFYSKKPASFLAAILIPTVAAGATIRRDKEGETDASFQIRQSFNHGRDSFSPIWKMKDRSVEYEWLHKFPCGSYLKAVLESRNMMKVEWTDAVSSGGRWVAKALIPLKDPRGGSINIRREFSF